MNTKFLLGIILLLALFTFGCQKGELTKENIGDFEDFIKLKSGLKYTATYDITSPIQDPHSVTIYIDSEDKIRIDSVSFEAFGVGPNSEVAEREYRLYNLEGDGHSCIKREEPWYDLPAGWICEESDKSVSLGDILFGEVAEEIESNPEAFQIDYSGTMELSGETAYCFEIPMPTETMKECFNQRGLLVYASMTSEVEYRNGEMKIKDYKFSIGEEDFNLPTVPEVNTVNLLEESNVLEVCETKFKGTLQELTKESLYFCDRDNICKNRGYVCENGEAIDEVVKTTNGKVVICCANAGN